jgi:leucyl aminopeptidase (aminopeptidase T)
MIAAAVSGWCLNYLAAAGVRPGERLRIVVDEPVAAEAEELAEAARALGAEARIACYPAERPILEPTAELMDTAAWADVSITLMERTFVEEQLAGRATLEALLSHGGRALSSPGIDRETLLGELSQPMTDVEQAARTLLAAVEGARELHVRGAAGTDVRLRVDGRRWVDDALPLEPGGVANFPGGEICIAPLAHGADGVLVVDLTIPHGPSQELLREPVVLRFEHGRARSIEGGEAGDTLRRLVEEAGEGADVIAELGIGLNPSIRPRGHVLFDEKAAGTAHVAIGNNLGPYGGDNFATIHVDCVFSAPELVVDGVPVAIP